MMTPVMPMCPALFVYPSPTRVFRRGVQVVGLVVAHRVVCCRSTGSSLSAYFIRSARLLFPFLFFFLVGSNFNHDFRDDFGIREQVLP